MKIRNRLTLSFTVIASLILIFSSVQVYVLSSDYRTDDFHQRMVNKGTNAAKLLLQFEEINANVLRRIEKDNPSNLPNEKIIIFDDKNNVLYSSDENNEIKVTNDFLNQVRLNRKINFNLGEEEAVGFLFTEKFDRFAVIVAAKDIYGLRRLRNLSRVLILVSSVGIGLIILGGWIFSSQAIKPIQRVIQDVNLIGINNLHDRVSEGNGKDEIAQLAQTFNNMLARLEEAFRLQKNFIANASHELRTPLTIISGEIEVLLRKDRHKEDYTNAIKSVYDEISTLSKVSNQLLLLAQTSSERREQALIGVRCDELIWQVKTEMKKINPQAVIDVRMAIDQKEAYNYEIPGNPHLLKTVFMNLVENACKYSPNEKVAINIHSDFKNLYIAFSNAQVGLLQEEVGLLFEPFYRGKNSPRFKGNGLGLSLVKNIMDRHHGKIEIEVANNMMKVSLTFPTKSVV